jgi:hypothetical protein
MNGSSCLRAAALLSLLVLTGCVNGFEKYYKTSPSAAQVLKSPYNAPASATPLIYNYSNDPKVDNHNAMRAGYVYVGSADFYATASKVSQSQLIAQAKSVGASLVLIHTSFKDTVSGSVPFTVQNAPVVST